MLNTMTSDQKQEGFRWLHASGTTIGSYTIGNGTLAALRPVYPGGSNVVVRICRQVLPLAQGQRRARNDRSLQVAANCCLLPVKPDGRHFDLFANSIRDDHSIFQTIGVIP
jgi:hypothetical protein